MDSTPRHPPATSHVEDSPAPESGPTYYANTTRAHTSLFEIQLAFFQDVFTGKGDERQARHLCNVAMSPQHAKAVLSVLAAQVTAYEEKMGEIRLTPKE